MVVSDIFSLAISDESRSDSHGGIERLEARFISLTWIAPSITNTGMDKKYVFIRNNCSDDNIFSFTSKYSD